ncbi:MAG: outer membrane beta-barrel protein [Chitinophagaceae bacterium]|nr:outer membrane beta-barrel protein [Chitinophagaceae bacterium]
MKKIVLLFALSLTFVTIHAQDTLNNSNPGSGINNILLKSRPGQHFMLQYTLDYWRGMPDSISSHQGGFSRGFGAYFMFDKRFKTSRKLSFGIGAGFSTSNIFFKKMDLGLNSLTPKLPFTALDSADHFKKYKLATTYLEIPLELRFTGNPDNYTKGIRAALGLKLGTLVNAHTKGKSPVNKDNQSIGSYTEKINSKRFINGSRFMATARVGYGVFNITGAYGLSNVLKDGVGPSMKLFEIGLMVSGL